MGFITIKFGTSDCPKREINHYAWEEKAEGRSETDRSQEAGSWKLESRCKMPEAGYRFILV